MNGILSRFPYLALPKQGVVRYALEAAIFVPFYLAVDWASYIEPLGSFNITPWNPGPALAIVWMMHAGLARAPVVLAATFLADDVVRDLPGDYGITLLGALTLTAGYALIAAILRALFPHERILGTIRALTALVSVVVIGAAINGAAFLGVLAAAGLLSEDVLAQGWLRFWIGDVVGILVTAPLLLIAMDADKRSKLAGLLRRSESYLQVGVIATTLWVIVSGLVPDPSHGIFLLFPPLIWIALRSGLAGALVAVTIVQLGIVIAFHQQTEPALPIIELQVLVATLTLTGLYLGVMVDERQRAMERLNQSLHLAAAGEMAGAITHEVSQPLTALASYSRSARLLIQAGRGDAELASLVDKIFTESLRASRVVRRLREFFRAGSMRLQPLTSVELLDMIGRLGMEVTDGTTITFAKDSESDLPAVCVDRLQVELVLRNLLGNAVDSLEEHAPGRGRITVSVKRDRGKRLCIAVADNGPGIPAAAREYLFRPFASGKANGMGLGLAVSRAIAEAHGGSLTVESAQHGEFHLILPLEPGNG
jgi:two-component system sensor kinase FixL